MKKSNADTGFGKTISPIEIRENGEINCSKFLSLFPSYTLGPKKVSVKYVDIVFTGRLREPLRTPSYV